jgi:hypothetical protein
LAKELNRNTKKSWRYRIKFQDLEGFENWRDWLTAREDERTAIKIKLFVAEQTA